ncbi:monovalent cation/H(+) antiporter subunit G [Planctomycetota bacterium]
MNIVVIVLVSTGLFFLGIGTLGLLRFPDFYSRAHATGKCDTLGMLLTLIGLTIYAWSLGWWLVGVKIMIIALFILLANPTAIHALTRAAFLAGVKPWTKKENPKQ